MILTKNELNSGLSKPLKIRHEQYKKWRKPKHTSPFCKYTAFVCCYGELNAL